MSIYRIVVIPDFTDMKVFTTESDSLSNTTFNGWVESYIRLMCEDSHDEEEMEEIFGEIWNSHQVKDGVHMVRTDSETIIMTQL